MGYLIDTHILLWFLNGDNRLSKKFSDTIINSPDAKYVSIASIWEFALKTSLDKLKTDYSVSQLIQLIEKNRFELLHVDIHHCEAIVSLPYHHRDPFDRMLISQGITEDLSILTEDQHFKLYQVKLA